ncbi:MAG: hypothetical protein HY815_04270 [Candidatus Riflebacteria bacterium]|nr:hypothetical protein [Candidatus Riflebacteria bacterium]
MVLIIIVTLCLTTMAMSLMGSTTTRSCARTTLSWSCLEAAGSAFAEATLILHESLRQGAAPGGAGVNWKQELLPPFDRPMSSGVVVPETTRALFWASPASGSVSDVEVKVVSWAGSAPTPTSLVRAYGVIELSVKVASAAATVRMARTVRQRFRFYVRNAMGDSPTDALTPERSEVCLVTPALGTVVE